MDNDVSESLIKVYNLYLKHYLYDGNWGSSVSIVSDYGLDDKRIFPLTFVSRPALRPTQSPVQWVPGALSLWVKRSQGVMLTTYPV
jgi:hypothetical protein